MSPRTLNRGPIAAAHQVSCAEIVRHRGHRLQKIGNPERRACALRDVGNRDKLIDAPVRSFIQHL